MKITAVATLFAWFLMNATTTALAVSAKDQVDNAQAIAKSWVGLIDAGKYEESYDFGCSSMHEKIAEDRWELVLKTLRAPWGAVAARQQISHVYKPNGFEGTGGEFIVITYETTFAKSLLGTEVVVLKWEDGKWRGAGYNARLKNNTDAPSQPQAVTEVHTSEHVKPTPPKSQ